jgi:hypothetical protein
MKLSISENGQIANSHLFRRQKHFPPPHESSYRSLPARVKDKDNRCFEALGHCKHLLHHLLQPCHMHRDAHASLHIFIPMSSVITVILID